ncbi:MAG: hypothetical protein KGM18_06435 [Sphingomonadales bacterium]|nr:hypothetical protein [Sphingomonadales bacterium]
MDRFKRVLECACEVMREIDPAWSEQRVKPVKPFMHKSPVKLGQTAKLTLDVLREATETLTSREVATRILELQSVSGASATVRSSTMLSIRSTCA